MSTDSFEPFICLSVRVQQSGTEMIESIGAMNGLRRVKDTSIHQQVEPRDLRKSIVKALAALDNYEACVAAGIATCTGEEFEKVREPKRGGPTEEFPNAPYCKPDQSCCDFVCGN